MQRVLSLQHSDLDFTPIIKITLRELGDIVKRERAISISQPSISANFAEGSSAILAEGPAVTLAEKSFAPLTENLSVPLSSKIEESSGHSGDAVLTLPIQRECHDS